MEYTLVDFTNKLKEWFIDSPLFPYYAMSQLKEYEIGLREMTAREKAKQESASSKHPNRHPVHLQEVARQCVENTTTISGDTATFDYGNVVMETNYPHYHILEDTQIIRKRYRATKKSLGSEKYVPIAGKRDYGKVHWNGKTFTKEYSRNVRGSRNRMQSVSHWGLNEDLQHEFQNKDSNAYYNVHYKYIENILDQDVVYKLTSYFGLKLKRKQDSGLIDEFAMQEDVSIESVLEAFDSFM